MPFGLFTQEDWTGKFDGVLATYREMGENNGNSARYGMFDTLNKGAVHGSVWYGRRINHARKYYGLGGKPDHWWGEERGSSIDIVNGEWIHGVVHKTASPWMGIMSWLYWFKVGFLGL